jgi:hypothetical protein
MLTAGLRTDKERPLLLHAATLRNRPGGLWASSDGAPGFGRAAL